MPHARPKVASAVDGGTVAGQWRLVGFALFGPALLGNIRRLDSIIYGQRETGTGGVRLRIKKREADMQDVMEDQVLESEQTLGQDVRQIVGGVVGLALIIVPIILIRKLARSIEGSNAFEGIVRALK